MIFHPILWTRRSCNGQLERVGEGIFGYCRNIFRLVFSTLRVSHINSCRPAPYRRWFDSGLQGERKRGERGEERWQWLSECKIGRLRKWAAEEAAACLTWRLSHLGCWARFVLLLGRAFDFAFSSDTEIKIGAIFRVFFCMEHQYLRLPSRYFFEIGSFTVGRGRENFVHPSLVFGAVVHAL